MCLPRCMQWTAQIRWLLVGLAVGSCGVPKLVPAPTAGVMKVEGPWSYCEPPSGLSLASENAPVLASPALRVRSSAPYDVLIVPGYTPDNGEPAVARVHPIAMARLDLAIALYREGKSHVILVAGGRVYPVNTPYTESLMMKTYLLEHGVPASAVVVEPCARHSTTNLRNAGRFMLKYQLRTALVVTSADQAFYFANGEISTFYARSREELGYLVGELKNKTTTTVEFAPSPEVFRRGADPLDP